MYKSIFATEAFVRLQELARQPFDLSMPGALLESQRLQKYQVKADPFTLFYATEQIDEPVLKALQGCVEESLLVEQFQGMRRGEAMNRLEGYECENRRVLHCSTRDIFSGSPVNRELTQKSLEELSKLKRFLGELENGTIVNGAGETFTTMVQVGVGGSELGPRALYKALKAYSIHGRKVYFISNVDPDDVSTALRGVDLSRTLFNIVSKSGTTLETATNENFVRLALEEAGLDPAIHCVAVTGKGSVMDDRESYRAVFYMYDSIGGRYSTTSMVGCVMLGFVLGYDQVIEILRGAADMDLHAEEKDIRKNIPLLMALIGIWNRNILNYSTLSIVPYCEALRRFPTHLQQCDMESNGKSVDRLGGRVGGKTGPIIWGEAGTNGQHAFFQLLHQGTEIVPIEFIGFAESQYGKDTKFNHCTSQQKMIANLFAQMVALATGKDDNNPNRFFEGNRPSMLLFAKRLTPYVMGSLLSCYEAKIVFQGFAWNINSFDQEGVQLGKNLADRFLKTMATTKKDPSSIESAFLGELEKWCNN